MPVQVDARLQNLPDNRPMAIGNINAAVGHVRMEVDRNALPADGQSVVNVKVTLFDKNDQPLSSKATITIEASAGRIHLLDRATDELGPARGDLDHVTPGVQMDIAHGIGQFQVIAPSVPTNVIVRITVGSEESHRAHQLCAGTASDAGHRPDRRRGFVQPQSGFGQQQQPVRERTQQLS